MKSVFRYFSLLLLTFLGFTTLASAQISIPASGVINTIAGTGTNGSSGDGGAATSATVSPTDVAVDPMGNVYVADYFPNRVRKIDRATGVITTVAGTGASGYTGDGGPATSATLNGPIQIAVDPGGNIFIADIGNHVVRKVAASTGIISTVAGNGTYGDTGDGGPATSATLGVDSVTVDGGGNLYICDYDGSIVRKVDGTTGIISRFAGNGTYGFSGDGGAATSAELSGPISAGVDGKGNVYIATYVDNRVREVFASNGNITTVAGNGTAGFSGDSGPATSAELYEPNGVAVDAAGDIYIADSLNQRIRLVTAGTGVITTLAGNGTQGFSGDGGAATSAELNGPVGVAADTAGTVYIADDFNARIRAIGPAPASGYVDPKFVVLAVTYAPPGASSNVLYSNNSTLGTSTALTNSLNNGSTYSTSVGAGFKIFGIGSTTTSTASTSYSQEADTSSSVAVTSSTTAANEVRGPSSSAAGIDHSYDIVYVWLNPKLSLTTTNVTTSMIWNGYSYDARDDANEMEVVPLYVTWLENPSSIPMNVAARLARSWDSTLGGLTTADYATIAARDPFVANPSYDPSSDGSGRFDLTGNTTFTYEPPPAGGQPITQTYSLMYSTTSTAGQAATDTYTTSSAIDTSASAGFNLSKFSATISDDFKSSTSITQTNKYNFMDSSTEGQGASLSITGPATSDGYTGPTQIQVWKDNVYGTFMFYPVE